MKISVVIPCYNCAGTIRQTIDSILAQTYTGYETIAVDDGSADDTAAVLSEYGDKIKYVYQTNSGVSAARNNGVAHATGDWIAFCDADDLWSTQKLEIIAGAIENCPKQCDFVFSDYSIMDDGVISEPKGMMSDKTMFPVFREFGINIKDMFVDRANMARAPEHHGHANIDYFHGNIFKWLILGNVILPSAAVVRKAAYQEAGGFNDDFRNAEDTEFFLRLSKASRFLYIDEPLITYRRTSTSLLATSMLKTMTNGARAVEINCKENPEVYRVHKSAVDRSLARKYARLGYFYLSELEPGNALVAAKRSLTYRRAESLAWIVAVASVLPPPLLGVVRKCIAALKR